ncbi:unnamed protein product, partial [Medioppia subpectinata]
MLYNRHHWFTHEISDTAPGRTLTLNMQMDWCLLSLKTALSKARDYFGVRPKRLFPPLGLYMASELLLELIECVHYLHTRHSPVIHRNIKPNNITIAPVFGSHGCRFVRLSDFELAVNHSDNEHGHSPRVASIKYMAPEVMDGHTYDTKADMYSIGVTLQELFNFDMN